MLRIKKLFKNQSQLIIFLLMLIFILVALPYLSKAYRLISEWKKSQIVTLQWKVEQWKEEKAGEKRKGLLKKYEIKSIAYSLNYKDGDINPQVFTFLNAYENLNTNWKDYDCNNPPLSTPTPTSRYESSFYKPGKSLYDTLQGGVTPSSLSSEPNGFINLCKEVENGKKNINEFERDIPKIKNLIKDNKYSKDGVIQEFVKKLETNLSSYEIAKKEANYVGISEEEFEDYYEVYKNPFVIYLRKALNSYLANDSSSINIAIAAVRKDKREGIVSGLDSFDKDYYKSKFVVLTFNKSISGGVDMQLMFQDKPDRIFYAWIYPLANGEYELRGFNSKEHFDQAGIKELNRVYKQVLQDKEHAL